MQLPEPEETYGRERPGKSRDRLQAAVLRKQGRTLWKIARVMGRGISTIHRWLSRMEREGPDGRRDGRSPGRPRLLNPEQERTIEGDMDGTPRGSGFGRGSPNAGTAAGRISDRLGVPYSSRPATRPAHRRGFSAGKPPTSPVERRRAGGAEVHQEGTGGRRRVAGRTAAAAGAATLRDPPVSRRGTRRRGGRGAVPANHSGQHIRMAGAPDLRFRGDLPAGSYVELVERLRRGEAGAIADNAGSLAGGTTRKRPDGAGGDVGVPHPAAPHPAAQPHMGGVEGDQGCRRRHL